MSIMLMIIGIYLQEAKDKILADIILNIGLGCFASTIVALIIEFENIKEKMKNIMIFICWFIVIYNLDVLSPLEFEKLSKDIISKKVKFGV